MSNGASDLIRGKGWLSRYLMNLPALFAFWFLMMSLAACSREPARMFPQCFKSQSIEKLSSSEQKALAHTKGRLTQDCSRSGSQCQFKVSRNQRNEIIVGADFFEQDQNTGRCVEPVGWFVTDVYTTDGDFVRSIGGL